MTAPVPATFVPAPPPPRPPMPRPHTPRRPPGHPRPLHLGSRGIWKDTRVKPVAA